MIAQVMVRTGDSRERGNAEVAVRWSPFTPLERQARRLQSLAACLVSLVAIIPALVFFLVGLSDLRSDTERHARHLSSAIRAALAPGSSMNLDSLSRRIKEDMVSDDLSSVSLLGENGREILRLGDWRGGLGTTEVAVQLPDSAGSVREIRVEADDQGFHRRAVWVLGIHLLVAALLAVVAYRLPMRALWGAIDRVKKTQDQLVHSEKLAAIGGMYAALTHEINNPLGILLTRVRLMLDSADEEKFPAELVHDLRVIERQGSRIADIARSLLTFAQKTELRLEDTDVNTVITDTIELVECAFARQGIRIQSHLDSPLPRVRASADHLRQALLNMVNNARDAMPDGGTVTLETYVNGRSLVIEIGDTGGGMPSEVQAHVFEPFFTTKAVGRGTGLGLSVSHGIVRAHGGEIAVESIPGKGTTFRVTLPI